MRKSRRSERRCVFLPEKSVAGTSHGTVSTAPNSKTDLADSPSETVPPSSIQAKRKVSKLTVLSSCRRNRVKADLLKISDKVQDTKLSRETSTVSETTKSITGAKICAQTKTTNLQGTDDVKPASPEQSRHVCCISDQNVSLDINQNEQILNNEDTSVIKNVTSIPKSSNQENQQTNVVISVISDSLGTYQIPLSELSCLRLDDNGVLNFDTNSFNFIPKRKDTESESAKTLSSNTVSSQSESMDRSMKTLGGADMVKSTNDNNCQNDKSGAFSVVQNKNEGYMLKLDNIQTITPGQTRRRRDYSQYNIPRTPTKATVPVSASAPLNSLQKTVEFINPVVSSLPNTHNLASTVEADRGRTDCAYDTTNSNTVTARVSNSALVSSLQSTLTVPSCQSLPSSSTSQHTHNGTAQLNPCHVSLPDKPIVPSVSMGSNFFNPISTSAETWEDSLDYLDLDQDPYLNKPENLHQKNQTHGPQELKQQTDACQDLSMVTLSTAQINRHHMQTGVCDAVVCPAEVLQPFCSCQIQESAPEFARAVSLYNNGSQSYLLHASSVVINGQQLITFEKEGKLYVSLGELKMKNLITNLKRFSYLSKSTDTVMTLDENELEFLSRKKCISSKKQKRCLSLDHLRWIYKTQAVDQNEPLVAALARNPWYKLSLGHWCPKVAYLKQTREYTCPLCHKVESRPIQDGVEESLCAACSITSKNQVVSGPSAWNVTLPQTSRMHGAKGGYLDIAGRYVCAFKYEQQTYVNCQHLLSYLQQFPWKNFMELAASLKISFIEAPASVMSFFSRHSYAPKILAGKVWCTLSDLRCISCFSVGQMNNTDFLVKNQILPLICQHQYKEVFVADTQETRAITVCAPDQSLQSIDAAVPGHCLQQSEGSLVTSRTEKLMTVQSSSSVSNPPRKIIYVTNKTQIPPATYYVLEKETYKDIVRQDGALAYRLMNEPRQEAPSTSNHTDLLSIAAKEIITTPSASSSCADDVNTGEVLEFVQSTDVSVLNSVVSSEMSREDNIAESQFSNSRHFIQTRNSSVQDQNCGTSTDTNSVESQQNSVEDCLQDQNIVGDTDDTEIRQDILSMPSSLFENGQQTSKKKKHFLSPTKLGLITSKNVTDEDTIVIQNDNGEMYECTPLCLVDELEKSGYLSKSPATILPVSQTPELVKSHSQSIRNLTNSLKGVKCAIENSPDSGIADERSEWCTPVSKSVNPPGQCANPAEEVAGPGVPSECAESKELNSSVISGDTDTLCLDVSFTSEEPLASVVSTVDSLDTPFTSPTPLPKDLPTEQANKVSEYSNDKEKDDSINLSILASVALNASLESESEKETNGKPLHKSETEMDMDTNEMELFLADAEIKDQKTGDDSKEAVTTLDQSSSEECEESSAVSPLAVDTDVIREVSAEEDKTVWRDMELDLSEKSSDETEPMHNFDKKDVNNEGMEQKEVYEKVVSKSGQDQSGPKKTPCNILPVLEFQYQRQLTRSENHKKEWEPGVWLEDRGDKNRDTLKDSVVKPMDSHCKISSHLKVQNPGRLEDKPVSSRKDCREGEKSAQSNKLEDFGGTEDTLCQGNVDKESENLIQLSLKLQHMIQSQNKINRANSTEVDELKQKQGKSQSTDGETAPCDKEEVPNKTCKRKHKLSKKSKKFKKHRGDSEEEGVQKESDPRKESSSLRSKKRKRSLSLKRGKKKMKTENDSIFTSSVKELNRNVTTTEDRIVQNFSKHVDGSKTSQSELCESADPGRPCKEVLTDKHIEDAKLKTDEGECRKDTWWRNLSLYQTLKGVLSRVDVLFLEETPDGIRFQLKVEPSVYSVFGESEVSKDWLHEKLYGLVRYIYLQRKFKQSNMTKTKYDSSPNKNEQDFSIGSSSSAKEQLTPSLGQSAASKDLSRSGTDSVLRYSETPPGHSSSATATEGSASSEKPVTVVPVEPPGNCSARTLPPGASSAPALRHKTASKFHGCHKKTTDSVARDSSRRMKSTDSDSNFQTIEVMVECESSSSHSRDSPMSGDSCVVSPSSSVHSLTHI